MTIIEIQLYGLFRFIKETFPVSIYGCKCKKYTSNKWRQSRKKNQGSYYQYKRIYRSPKFIFQFGEQIKRSQQQYQNCCSNNVIHTVSILLFNNLSKLHKRFLWLYYKMMNFSRANQINKLEGWNTYIKDEIIEELRSEEIIQ